ncbi:MAG TPA: Eco57I restriction-modification methylase domain-containing protein [Lactobacillaceae bacterium]|jgi:superfamily II DNA or RNA helicase
MQSNFDFLKLNVDEDLQTLFQQTHDVEQNYANGTYTTIMGPLRPVIEHVARYLADQHYVKLSQHASFHDVLKQLSRNQVLPKPVMDLFSDLKNQGNTASHVVATTVSQEEALRALHKVYDLLVWLVNEYYDQQVVANFKEPVAQKTYQTMAERKLVYVQTANNDDGLWPAYDGLEKIGEASTPADDLEADWSPNSEFLRETATHRVRQYMNTSGVPFTVQWAELAWIKDKREWFHDYDVHNVLQRSNYKRAENVTGDEWYQVDLETAKKAIKAVKEGRQAIDAPAQAQTTIELRPEQADAVAQTRKVFKKSAKMLWNAKMRFGKTLTALELIKQEAFQKVLIMTHRPVVSDSWFEDFNKMQLGQAGYLYGSKDKGEHIETLVESNSPFIYFASIQDLRGSETVGGKAGDKNKIIFDTPWDLVIIDEAHEGTQTQLAGNVLRAVTTDKTKTLELSGTPFNLLNDYDEDQVFTWDYVMEQEAKAKWNAEHPNTRNPYERLPKVSMYTFAMRNSAFVDETKAFNFREFFRTDDTGKFVYEADVNNFLDEITRPDKLTNYPYSTPDFRETLRHTLWLVPGVKEAKALTALMQEHPVFGQEYKIINIVDNDKSDNIEEASQKDLERVRQAITNKAFKTKTITITVRKLTTGVNVPEWTAVMFLNNTTSAMQYLQAAFRAQTPYADETGMKENAYIFDFAPDRALTVMAESTGLSTGVGKVGTQAQKDDMARLLNFLPILGQNDHGMTEYKVDKLLNQIKRVYAEKAVRSGFDDDSLYSEALLRMDQADLDDFKNLQAIVGSTKREKLPNKIDVNNQGLSDEEYDNKEKGEKKKPKDRSEAEKAAIEKAKALKRHKQTMISILRGISIRVPMMIYGMDVDLADDITIDNFATAVDQQSWDEFMPKGVTKGEFAKYKKYYDAEVFIEAGRIIRRKVKELDALPPIERAEELAIIFGSFKNPDKETVLTPWRVVNLHMSKTVGGLSFFDDQFEQTRNGNMPENHWVTTPDTAKVFKPNTKILEINSKTGLYPLYAATSLYYQAYAKMNETQAGKFTPEDEEQLWQDILANNIYVVAKTPMAKTITQRTLAGYRDVNTNVAFVDNIVETAKTSVQDGVNLVKEAFTHMKFDVVIGNPPYQEESAGASSSSDPVFHHFMDLSYQLADKVTLITPARFLSNAGKTPAKWNQKMLADEHLKVVYYEAKSDKIFPNTDIKGGVVITYRDAQTILGPIGTFTSFPELSSIVKKVDADHPESLNSIAFARTSYSFSDIMHQEHPELESLMSKGHQYDVGSNVFDILKGVFFDEKPDDGDDYVELYGLKAKSRTYQWIKRVYLKPHANLDKYKVLVPKSNGSGALGETLSTPLIGEPLIGHTETFMSFGDFDSEQEAQAALKYIKSKFARVMLGVLKVTQDNPLSTWAKVPLQDFTANSDIDWTQSIPEIDAQLYAKYQLTPDEIQFIEEKVTAMK